MTPPLWIFVVASSAVLLSCLGIVRIIWKDYKRKRTVPRKEKP